MLVPIIPTTLSLRTYSQIIDYVNEHKKLSLKVLPFFSMLDRRKKLHLEITGNGENSIRGILHTSIPYLSIIEQMGVNRAPVGMFAPNSQAATLFDQLWTEIVLRAKINCR
jgi:cellulose biosynthesis protein BcsQ